MPEASPALEVSQQRLTQFMDILSKCFKEYYPAQDLELQKVKAFFKKEEKKSPFSDVEMDACIEKMADDNKVLG